MRFVPYRPAPEAVFTPRSAVLNEEMYIARPRLERALKAALRGSLHIVLHGQSGTGKSWLYKKVLQDEEATVFPANLANASRLGSITAELKNLVDRLGRATKRSSTSAKKAKLNALAAEGAIEQTTSFDVGSMEPFEACLQMIRDASQGTLAALVFDNLESAYSDEKLLKELANLIILLDDERYATYRVKILIVGVPGDIREYYFNTPHLRTVANRLYELPEISRLTQDECFKLVKRGFIDKLGYDANHSDWNVIRNHIAWVTDRVPQRVHEYCLVLATLAKASRTGLSSILLRQADREWLRQSLYSTYSIIESVMNGSGRRGRRAVQRPGRRNQCLYVLGLFNGDEFSSADIDELIRREFPNTTSNKMLNVPAMLAELAAANVPIIRRAPRGDKYMITDPIYRMGIRTMLQRDDEIVWKLDLAEVLP